jgi:hypothetical protein
LNDPAAQNTSAELKALDDVLNKPSTGKTDPAPPIDASVARAAVVQAKEQMKAAADLRTIATKELASVATAPNPAAAQVLLRDVEDRISNARNLERRVFAICLASG